MKTNATVATTRSNLPPELHIGLLIVAAFVEARDQRPTSSTPPPKEPAQYVAHA